MTNNNSHLNFYIILSIILHIVILGIVHYGLPSLFKPLPEEEVMVVEMVQVTDTNNVKTQKIQAKPELKEEKAKKVVKSEQTAAKEEPVKDNKIEEEAPKVIEKEAEAKKDAVIAPAPEKPKPEPKKPKAEKPKPTKKSEQKLKAEPKKKVATEKDLDALLKTLEQASEGTENKAKKQAHATKSDAKTESEGNFNSELPISISETQAIRQQVMSKWNVPIGITHAHQITVTLYIALKIDGTVEQVKLHDQFCPAEPQVCRAAADSAIRAVWQASPIEHLSSERYNSWRELHLTFDPNDLLD